MNPAKLAQDLLNFLRDPANSRISLGIWTRIIGGGGNITDYSVDFNNSGTVFRIRIWLTSGKSGAYNPPRWYFTVTDITPKSVLEIHNMDMHNPGNHHDISLNVSDLIESGIRLGASPLKGITIAHIDDRVSGWENIAIRDILNHELIRLAHKVAIRAAAGVAIIPSTSPKIVSETTGGTTIMPSKIGKRKTPYQKLVIRCLLAVLIHRPLASNKKLSQRFKDHVIKPLVRHYPEITRSSETTNGKVHLYQKFFKWSERAVYELSLFPSGTKNKLICDNIKMEHIYPVNMVANELFNLSTSYNIREIINIFNYFENIFNNGVTLKLGFEILIVSFQEAIVLNRSIDTECELIDLSTGLQKKVKGAGLGNKGIIAQRLAAANITLDLSYIKNTL